MRDLASDAEVRRLCRALALSTRFHFYILACNAVVIADAVLAIVEREVAAAREEPVRVVRLDPYRAHADFREPIAEGTLATEVLERLVTAESAGSGAIWVVDASKAVAADDEGWAWLFQRMNRQRNVIAERLRGELILCIPPRMEGLFARSAPDLWSIRSGEFSVTPRMTAAERGRSSAAGWMDRGEPRPKDGPAEAPASERGATAGEPNSEQSDDEEPPALRARAVLLGRKAEVLMADARAHRDDLKRAEASEALLKAAELRRRLVAIAPENPEAIHALAAALVDLGDVTFERGGLGDAAAAYNEALAFVRWLLSRNPERPERLRDLSVSLNRVGDLHRARGDLERALNAYDEGLELRRQLLRRDPERPEWLRDLAVSLDRVGDVHRARGDLERALNAYDEGLALMRQLLRRDPERPEWLRDLAVSLNRVGDVHQARGDLERALNAYNEGLELRRQLLQRDPERPKWLRDLSVSLDRVGDVHQARGDLERALNAYNEGLELSRQLLQRDPDRPEWMHDLAVSLGRVGLVHQARGDREQARNAYNESLSIMRDLLTRDPTRPQWLNTMGWLKQQLDSLRR